MAANYDDQSELRREKAAENEARANARGSAALNARRDERAITENKVRSCSI